MNEEKALFSTRQAANYLGYSLGAMRISRMSGLLGGIKAPNHIKLGVSDKSHARYEKSELDGWIERAKQK